MVLQNATKMTRNAGNAQLIGLDWGSSSLRAYLLGLGGRIVHEISLPLGIMPVRQSLRLSNSNVDLAFQSAIDNAIGEWIRDYPSLPIVAAGMIGSSHGWKEVPYQNAPFDIHHLGSHLDELRTSSGMIVHIVPGIVKRFGLPNVMRGEETQILGVWATESGSNEMEEMLIGLPGTHSKWCFLRGSHIMDFETFMTGELYAVVCQHTILGQTMSGSADGLSPAFDRGVQVAGSTNGLVGILSTMFSVRSFHLVGQLPSEEQAEYLSGLLIGHEIQGVLRWMESKGFSRKCFPRIRLSGDSSLCMRYRRALALSGIDDAVTASNTSAIGLWQVAIQAGLTPTPDASRLERGIAESC